MDEQIPLGLCVNAFLFDAFNSIMEADGPADPSQEEHLYKTISPGLMAASGFVDASGTRTNRRYAEALVQAQARLVSELPEGHGPGLCRRMWMMAAVDGRVSEPEIETIKQYGQVLGVSRQLNDEIGLDVLKEMSLRGLSIEVPDAFGAEDQAIRVGDLVRFGRPRGEKTLGVVVDITRSGKLKVRQEEGRGTKSQHEVGTTWTIPAELAVRVQQGPNGKVASVAVPMPVSGLAFTRPAGDALSDGWEGLSDAVGAMLSRLHAVTASEWLACVGSIDGMDRWNRPARLVAVWFCGATGSVGLTTLRESNEAFHQDWAFEGTQSLELGHPFPALVTVDGAPHRVLVQVEDEEPPEVFELGLEADGEVVTMSAAPSAGEPVASVRFLSEEPAER